MNEAALLDGKLQFSPDGATLNIVSEATRRRLTPKYLSPSSAKAMDGCRAKYAASRLLPRDDYDTLAATSKGTVTHEILEKLMGMPPAERTREAANYLQAQIKAQGVEGLNSKEKEVYFAQIADPTISTQWDTEITANIDNYFLLENPASVNVVGTEILLDGLEVAGVPFKGFIDRLDRLEDGTLQITDYKTGKKPQIKYGDTHGEQIRDYKLALNVHPQFPEETVSAGKLIYVTANKLVTPSVKTQQVNKSRKHFVEAWEILNNSVNQGAFTTQQGPLCAYCPLVLACPVAQTEGVTPNKNFKGAIPADRLFGELPQNPSPQTDNNGGLQELYDKYRNKWGEPNVEADLNQDCPTVNTMNGIPNPALVQPQPQTQAMQMPQPQPQMPQQMQMPQVQPQAQMPEQPSPINLTNAMIQQHRGFGWREAKPWEGGWIDGHVNGSSPDLTGAFGLVGFAIDQLNEAHIEPSLETTETLVRIFEAVIFQVQRKITNQSDLGMGFNARLRGGLRDVVRSMPLPFGDKRRDAWVEWANNAKARLETIAMVSLSLVVQPGYFNPEFFTVMAGLNPDPFPANEG